MKSSKEIQAILARNKTRLFKVYPIKSLAIFGSFSRNEQGANSDLDILVEFNDKIGLQFMDLANELEKLVETKVDLVSKKGVKKQYLESIEEDLIYV